MQHVTLFTLFIDENQLIWQEDAFFAKLGKNKYLQRNLQLMIVM